MKYIFQITFFVIIFFIMSLNISSAGYWYSWSNTDLYKQIDEWINELDIKMYDFEVSAWWWSIKTEINRILNQENLPSCMEVELSSEELKKISAWDIGLLTEKMWKKCFPDDTKSLSNDILIRIQSQINYIDTTAEKKSEKKSAVMRRIADIGIYSDWSLENSPFDLIADMQEIDEIIFSKKIEYNWEQNFDISWAFEDFLDDKSEESYSNQWNQIPKALKNDIYACLEDVNKNNWVNNYFSDIFSNNISSNTSSWSVASFGDYEKVTDNSIWPCEDIFCITVEFKTYEHKLLWGSSDNFSIEWVIKRSNEHLKKFTNVSLAQSKMWQNLFELNLRDLSLPDSFNVWLVVSSKPIPILDIENNEKKEDESEFAYKNILYEYYKNLWMDYPRKNSLVKYLHKEEKLKSFLDSSENSITLAEKKTNNYINNLEIQKKKNEYFKKAINKKIQTDEISVFYDNLSEIERFVWAINDYTTWLFWAVRWMDRIPVHRNW